jgi:WD40 repeat protein
MHTRPRARLLLILVLSCILIPAGLAAGPLWIVPSSPGEELSTVAISHDGSTIVAGGGQLIAISRDGTKLWSGWSGTTLGLSRDGRYIVTFQGQTVRLFARQGTMLWDQPLGNGVADVSISPDAQIIAAGGGNTVQSWYNSGAGLGKNVTETVHHIRLSPVKDQVIVTTAKALRSFNVSFVPNWYDDTISPGIVEISGDGTGIVIPNGNHVRMYHGSGTLLWDRSFPGGNIISLAYSDDGSTIVAGRDDTTFLVFDRDGTLLVTGHAGAWVTSVGVSDDGSTIATGSIDNQVRIFNRQGEQLLAYQTKSPIRSRSVAVSGDGSLIVAVDLSNVYGFSGSRFTVPAAPPTPANSRNASTGTLNGNATSVTMVPGAGIVPPFSVPVPARATGTTQSSGFAWVPALASLAFIMVARKK